MVKIRHLSWHSQYNGSSSQPAVFFYYNRLCHLLAPGSVAYPGVDRMRCSVNLDAFREDGARLNRNLTMLTKLSFPSANNRTHLAAVEDGATGLNGDTRVNINIVPVCAVERTLH